VLPSESAVSRIAWTIFFFRPVFDLPGSASPRASTHAQKTVPAQVRKSFAEKASPIDALM
jgi:hypothetical protein